MTTSTTDPRTAADYTASFAAASAPEAVYDALTSTTGLAAWWTPVAGDGTERGRLQFDMQSPLGPLVIEVRTARRPVIVVWHVVSCPFVADWEGTDIVFDLGRSPDGGCAVFFRHHGLTPQLECYQMCRHGWDHFLPSLRHYVETGTGDPLGSDADRARRADPGSVDPGH